MTRWGFDHLRQLKEIGEHNRRNAEIYTKWLNEERERKAGMSKFKVGDKVRRTLAGHPYAPVGFEAILLAGRGEELNYQGNDGDIFLLYEDHWELVEPANQGPVRTVTTTRKEIVPGKHGPLTVSDYPSYRRAKIQVEWAIMDKSQLYSLAADIRAMADALESGE